MLEPRVPSAAAALPSLSVKSFLSAAGIERGSCVAGMRREWVENVLLLVPGALRFDADSELGRQAQAQLGGSAQGHEDALTLLTPLARATFREIQEAYESSACKAILDYVLRSPLERRRLGIDRLPSTYRAQGWGPVAGGTTLHVTPFRAECGSSWCIMMMADSH